ncbi:MAG: hypothetical protein ED555_02660 [Allomuricauda sp.]|nr:MAG: hypothetical protein ED555_02660 [Allomuricauda sp.]
MVKKEDPILKKRLFRLGVFLWICWMLSAVYMLCVVFLPLDVLLFDEVLNEAEVWQSAISVFVFISLSLIIQQLSKYYRKQGFVK